MLMESGETATLPLGITKNMSSSLRPNSLLGPEKEPLNFQINLVGAPPEVEQLVEHIKSVAEQFLYHWKTFPIVLPTPLASGTSATSQRYRPLNLRDLFVAPPFDELDAVAADGTGEPHRLTKSQLQDIRERGEFEVPSLNFPGQVHRWRLSKLLQKGTERTKNSLLSDLALSARFVVVTARGRLFGHFFSIANALRALLNGFTKLVDAFVGVPSLLAHNLEYKIKEERYRFLIAELVCRTEDEDCLDSLCLYVRQQLRRAAMEKFAVECESVQHVPYIFLTPNGQEIDLRLFSKDIMRKAFPILIGILERETRGWFLHFRERLISELREHKLSDSEIEEEVNDAVMKEYLQRVYSSILSNIDIAKLGDGIPQLLVQQAQSIVIMHKAAEKVQRDIKHAREEHQRLLTNDYPVLSRVGPWLRTKLRSLEYLKMSKSTWLAHEEARRICGKHNLQQTSYFLSRDLAFMKEREPIILKELKNAKTPTRSFQWPLRIWSTKSWIIRRNFQGNSEAIPTLISQQATSIVTPRSDPSQPVYLVEKEIIRTTSTRWPFWRLLNFLQRTWCWMWNIMFLLGVIVPWCSPLGLRALFCVKPFMPDLELSQVNGTLFPRKTSITQTMVSRLLELWRHISKARTHFETEPDTGFIGKGLTRHLNRTWNYFVKGFLGTCVILFLFPVICLSVSLCSIIFAIFSPIWIPIITITLHIYMMFVYDIDCPDVSRNRYCVVFESTIWNIFIQGCLQPIAAIIVASVVCPFASVIVLIVGLLRYWIRLLWDSIMFHFFIKKCGRVPASNSIAVRRIAGPGLALDYYFQIKPEQALAAFEAKMEFDELQAYQHSLEISILQPQKDFSQFVEACFGPFSAQLSKSVGTYRNLERESHDLLGSLHDKLEKRRKDLETGLTTSVKNRIKLNSIELKITIQQAAHMLEQFYPTHVISRLSLTYDEYWDAKGLSVDDWMGLTALFFTDIFSLDFLTPLTETDTQFKLEPHSELDLSRYIELVQNASDKMGGNGPDLLENVYTPRGNIQINSPYLDISAFNPRSRHAINSRKLEKRNDTATGLTTPRVHAKRLPISTKATTNSWRPWKRKLSNRNPCEKLQIPLPIPHPVHIAIAIHNRDSEQPIPLDSDICWEVLRAIEDCQGNVQPSNVLTQYCPSGVIAGDSSNDSIESQSSGDARDSFSGGAGATETLPCGIRDVQPLPSLITTPIKNDGDHPPKSYHWTLNNWGAAQASRRGNNSQTVRVDLASPEDISLDTDSTRAVFSVYGTTV